MTDQTNFLYESIISDMSEGLMVIGFDGVITHLNAAAELILDKNRLDLIGKKFARCFFTYEENDEFNQAIIDAIYDRNSCHRNIVSYYNGSRFKQLSITTSFLHNDNSKIGIVVVLSDISELVELRDAVKAMERIKKLNDQLEMRNQLLSATFGRFLSDDIVKELLETPGGLEIGGKKRNVTIMMSDLRGFTQISEFLEPKRLIDMLNHYLSVMGDIITKYKGTIIEFLGDGILTVFGAPIECDNHATNAVCAAIEMQSAMAEINTWNISNGLPCLHMGVGIHSGDSIVGNLGSERHTKYGVIGKNVNLCGRIESYSVGGQILVSTESKNQIEDPLIIQKSFEVLPKGIAFPITIHEIVGIGGTKNLHCPIVEVELNDLDNPIEIEFLEIKEKHVDFQASKGRIVAISKTNAVIETDVDLTLFSNIEIKSKWNVFCKVIRRKETGYLVAFTSDPTSLLVVS